MPAQPFVVSLRYDDPLRDFGLVCRERGSFLLHSALQTPSQGRYSFWGSQPKSVFQSEDGFVTLDGHTQIDTPHEALKRLNDKVQAMPSDPYLPFSGGLVGFLGYEWGTQLENIASTTESAIPDCWFGLFDTIVTYDHLEKRAWIVSPDLETAEKLEQDILEHRCYTGLPPATLQAGRRPSGPRNDSREGEFVSNFYTQKYLDTIGRVRRYLQAGDCYQVNLSQQFSCPASRSAWEIFQNLNRLSPAPYSAYLHCGPFHILSSSPESLLEAKADGTLITRPIKGTRPRGVTKEEDEALKQELLASEKDRAELLMITDLERNDLGKVCLPGTVRTPKLVTLESFAQVHHLLSVVEGRRSPQKDIVDCLTAMLPGGSITGAPKVRAMQIIRELEPTRRNVYTGAIGWMGPDQTAHFNVAIRTITVHEGCATFSAGGGIVIDSDPQAEYAETLTKAKGMMQALGLAP